MNDLTRFLTGMVLAVWVAVAVAAAGMIGGEALAQWTGFPVGIGFGIGGVFLAPIGLALGVAVIAKLEGLK